MLKKTFAVLLALCAVYSLLLPAEALRDTGTIAVKLNSDIAGATRRDAERLIELQSPNVVLSTRGDGPVTVADYGGTGENGALKAGRTYSVYYTLTAAEGYELPETLRDGDVSITCGKGVKVISVQIVTLPGKNGEILFRGVQIFAQVVVDGNVFQRVIGYFYDVILKIKSWSLY